MTDYSMVKPTKYAGITFRSRLEARWAVFFDALGILWEYEPETFVVDWYGESSQYTPDFRINVTPDAHCRLSDNVERSTWVEVKPTIEALVAAERRIGPAIEGHGPCGAGLIVLGPVPDVRREGWPAHLTLQWACGIAAGMGMFERVGNDWEFVRRLDLDHSGSASLEVFGEYSLVQDLGGPRSMPAPRVLASAYDAARNERFGLGAAA